MDRDIILLGVGAILGFLSAVGMELTRFWLGKKRDEIAEKKLAKAKEYEKVKEFLSAKNEEGLNPPAWVTLLQMPKEPWLREIDEEATELPQFDSSEVHSFKKLSHPNEKYLVSDFQLIGRSRGCDIRVGSQKVSRKHALIRFEKGEFVIYNLSSNNITLVNDKPVPKEGTVLMESDVIVLGHDESTKLVFEKTSSSDNSLAKDLQKAIISEPATLHDIKLVNAKVAFCPDHGAYDASLGDCPYQHNSE